MRKRKEKKRKRVTGNWAYSPLAILIPAPTHLKKGI